MYTYDCVEICMWGSPFLLLFNHVRKLIKVFYLSLKIINMSRFQNDDNI